MTGNTYLELKLLKIALKTIIVGTSYRVHAGVQLKILPTLSSELLLLGWAQNKPLFRPGGAGGTFKQ